MGAKDAEESKYYKYNKVSAAKYKKDKIHRLNISYSTEEAERIKAYCAALGVPVQAFFKEAVNEKIERLGGDPIC